MCKESLYERVLEKLKQEEMEGLVKPEWFASQPTLIICGAGHVGMEVARMASYLEFRVKIMDDREEFTKKENFPWAEEVICDSFENLEKYLEEDAFYVVLTRGHQHDYQCVKRILGSKYSYAGMIGSKAKVQTTLDRLREDGYSEEVLQTLHAPIGLSIHAHTPAEIAVSILAEIIQEKNQKSASFVSKELSEVREKGVLCIIIEKRGSTPRGEGSMMFVGEDLLLDTIGGGSIEYEVIQDAKTIEKVEIREYSLNAEKGAEEGMICGGRNKVLFVPVG